MAQPCVAGEACPAAGSDGGPLDDDGAALLQLQGTRVAADQQSTRWNPQSQMNNIVKNARPKAGAGPSPKDPAYNPYGFCPQKSDAARRTAADKVGGKNRVTAENFYMYNAYIFSMGNQPVNPANNPYLKKNGPSGRWGKSWQQQKVGWLTTILLPTFLTTDGGNRTTYWLQSAAVSCWNPAPLGDGPMIFPYSDVSRDLSNPDQKRGYYTATVPQVEQWFLKETPLFLDGETHRGCRHLLKKTGFAFANNVNVAAVQKIQRVSGQKAPGPSEMAAIIGPIVFEQIWGAVPPTSLTSALKDYGSYGPMSIFGKYMYNFVKPMGISGKIARSLDQVSDWALKTPYAKTVQEGLKAGYGSPWQVSNKTLVKVITIASMFAGIVGTSDMTTKCVDYQKKMPGHVDMFKADPEKYLIELMRLDSAVTSITKLLAKTETMNLEGRSIKLAAGTPVQSVIATANRDPVHWTNPEEFDPNRKGQEDMLSWNGNLKDVEAMNLEKAPRYCPGYCLSLKVGAAACARMMGSYDELFAAGKLLANDGKVECNNFGTQ